MRRKGNLKYLAVIICAALALPGCAPRSAGGTLTQQGMTSLEEQDYDGALASFQQAAEEGEDQVMALRGEGIALMGLARYDEAAETLKMALASTDDKMPKTRRDIWLYMIGSLIRGGNYSEAVTQCEAMRQEAGETTELFYYLGDAYLGLGDEGQARENFDQAIASSPRDYTLYLQIYQAFESRALSAVGDEYLQKALSVQPQTAEEQYQVGEIYYYLGRYDEARNAISGPVDEKNVPALELLGEIYLVQEDYSHAADTYQTIMETSGESPEVYNGLALCAIASGDYDQALSYIGTGLALEEETGKQQLRYNEIVAYEKKLDFATALVKAEAYLSLYPTDEAGQRELIFLRTRGQ